MKRAIKGLILLLVASLSMTSCEKFLDVNTDPTAANVEQMQVEYFINSSITGAQQNPHVAERAFVLYWHNAGRFSRISGTLSTGGYNDGWSSDYYGDLSGWLKTANLAITVAKEKIENNSTFPYTENLMHVARIWRVYLMSEFADNFGPMPIDAFQGTNPEFQNLQTVYHFMLDELSDAVANIDATVANPESIRPFDKAYGFNFAKWKKYGNSMRLRLAMRLSEVEPAKAKAEFEAAAAADLILNNADAFKVAEMAGGWNDLNGVMTREWNHFLLSATLNNLMLGLGGIPSENQLPADLHGHIKPADYMGVRYTEHWATKTNDPSAGFWLDGLPHSIDPRAYEAFIIPGWFENPNFNLYPSWATWAPMETARQLLDVNGEDIEIDAAFTWNAAALGNWGPKGANNQLAMWLGANPRLGHQFRNGTNERIFFAAWETYFLLAEGAVRGWTTPMTAQAAYEAGVESSFQYWGKNQHLAQYLTSENYNRAGTSVSWNHTAEPPASVTMNYVDGYTNQAETFQFSFPQNQLYGANRNDHLNKIITQKYLAQMPYLPLEVWNDHRRLGLPFFENPAIEQPLLDMPHLTEATIMQSRVNHFPQRLKYPSSLVNSNPAGYQQAVEYLGGPDAVLTPLWWAKQP